MKHKKYDQKESKKTGIILAVFFVIFVILAGIYLYLYLDEKNVPEYLDITISGSEVTEVIYTQLQEDFTEKVNIAWQNRNDGEGKYLFLPSYARCEDMVIRLYSPEMDANAEITLTKTGDKPVQNTITEGKSYVWKDMGTGEFVIDAYNTETSFFIYKSENVPCLWITLDNTEGLSYIEADKEHVSSADVVITTENGLVDYSGRVEQFKGHGNSSWERQKKSYKMYLQQKSSLLGMDKCKKWVLISNVVDDTMMRNKLFTDMAISCGLDNTMNNEWVDLYVDGQYRGLYLLSEKIDINSENLDIGDLEKETKELNDEEMDSFDVYQMKYGDLSLQGWMIPEEPENYEGGYLLEIDYYRRYKGEPSKFHTLADQYVVVKSPEYATAKQIEYIAVFVQGFELAACAPDGKNESGLHYSQYIDMESFAKRYVLDEISKNIDSGYSSSYFYKPKDEMKMYAGPIWDYDTALGNNQDWGNNTALIEPQGFYANTHGWAEMLYNQPEFYEQVLYEYGRYFEPYLKNADGVIADYLKEIEASVEMNSIMWSTPKWRDEVKEMQEFLETRRQFLNSQWKK